MLKGRRAEPPGAAVISRHRVLMFRDMGWLAQDRVARQLLDAMIAWCRQEGDIWRVVLQASQSP